MKPSDLMRNVSATNFRRMLRLFPALRGTGVRVVHISDDWRHWELELPLTWRNLNYVGTHFGGALYASMDPHYMLAYIHILGPEYIVWDKAAHVRFKKPGKGLLKGTIHIPRVEVDEVKRLCEEQHSVDRTYTFQWVNRAGDVVTEVEKVLYFRKKRPDETSTED